MFITYAVGMAIGVVVLLASVIISMALIRILIRAARLASRGIDTTGHTVQVSGGIPGTDARVCVSYKTPDGMFETYGSSMYPRTGEEFRVRYARTMPDVSMVWPDRWRWAARCLPGALVAVALAAGMVIGSAWYFAGIHHRFQLPMTGGSFLLALSLICGWYATTRYTKLLRWRRMLRTEGKVLQFNENSPVGAGILISFQSAAGKEKFWDRAGAVNAGTGDEVTVYYDPSAPATSATVQPVGNIRAAAIYNTVFALGLGALGIYGLSTLL